MIDWQAIKTEYITTAVSYRDLARKYSVGLTNICKRSRAEDWIGQRKRYQNKAFTKTVEKVASKEADRLARLITATTRAIDVAMAAFEDDRQFNKYLVEKKEKYGIPMLEDDGETAVSERQWVEEQEFSKIDTKALKDLTGVLKDLTGLMRDFYNIPTPAQAEAQRIAGGRFELERKKAEADSADDGIEVVMSGEVAQWAK